MSKVFLVKTNGHVICAYARESTALTHAMTVTGAHVEEHDVLEHLAASASEDAATDDWDDNGGGVTPVDAIDVTTTQNLKRKKTDG